MKELIATVLTLPEDIRTPFTLFYKGVAKEDIAEQLNLSIDEVDAKIFQARQEIKNTIASDYGAIALVNVA